MCIFSSWEQNDHRACTYTSCTYMHDGHAIELWIRIKENGASPFSRNAISFSALRFNIFFRNVLDEIIAAGKVVPKMINCSDQNFSQHKIPQLTWNICAKDATIDCTELSSPPHDTLRYQYDTLKR